MPQERPSSIRLRSRLLFGAAVLLLAGCFAMRPGVTLTPQVIDQNGTRTYSKPYEKVVAATANAFNSLGFGVAFVNEDKGIVKSGRKTMAAFASRSGQLNRSEAQFQAEIGKTADGKIQVRLLPFQFFNNVDITQNEGAWYLEGQGALNETWAQVFAEIELQL